MAVCTQKGSTAISARMFDISGSVLEPSQRHQLKHFALYCHLLLADNHHHALKNIEFSGDHLDCIRTLCRAILTMYNIKPDVMDEICTANKMATISTLLCHASLWNNAAVSAHTKLPCGYSCTHFPVIGDDACIATVYCRSVYHQTLLNEFHPLVTFEGTSLKSAAKARIEHFISELLQYIPSPIGLHNHRRIWVHIDCQAAITADEQSSSYQLAVTLAIMQSLKLLPGNSHPIYATGCVDPHTLKLSPVQFSLGNSNKIALINQHLSKIPVPQSPVFCFPELNTEQATLTELDQQITPHPISVIPNYL